MATVTGTLILRPVASEGVINSSVPANTPIEEVYKLVNEEVADDDTTYIIPVSNEESYLGHTLCLRLFLPEGIKINSISELRCKTRYNGITGSSAVPATYSTKESLVLENEQENEHWYIGGLNSGYTDETAYGVSLEDELINFDSWVVLDYEKTKLCFNNNDFCLLIWSSAAKTAGNLTQIYLELDCEYQEGTGTPIYFKQNGLWSELSGTIYQKANGTWAEADVSVLSGEYPIEEAIL